MYNLNKKKRIIIGVIAIIIIGYICYYVYAKDENKNTEFENNLEIENPKDENNEIDENIIVHISGAVNKEGVIQLKMNSRISDAIEMAGGLRDNANTKNINLAYKLEDGMKIYIPTIEEQENKTDIDKNITDNEGKENLTNDFVTTSSGTSDSNSQNVQNEQIVKVNINSATQEQLESLPGIGPSTANKIINYRNENGKFNKIEDIKEVSGIGDAKFNKLKEFITVK